LTVLAAYKPSDEGNAVLEAAIQEARFRECELLVVRHVKREQAPLEVPNPPIVARQLPPRSRSGQDIEKLREELEGLAREIASQGIPCEAVLIDQGSDAADQLLDLASTSEDVDLIVVGVRRRSRVGKAVLGSDAQHIVLNASCAVLAVKA
jgi:nucleotide-binding universal stress UspA family protein